MIRFLIHNTTNPLSFKTHRYQITINYKRFKTRSTKTITNSIFVDIIYLCLTLSLGCFVQCFGVFVKAPASLGASPSLCDTVPITEVLDPQGCSLIRLSKGYPGTKPG